MNRVIEIKNLSKIYRLGEIGTGTISRDLERWFKMKVRGQEDPFLKIGEVNTRDKKGKSDIVFSLREINFDVHQGEALGIIGKNGAGKSTLLKIISRVTSPTTGKIKIKGRVASLLEVGTGFHPELTGRENIYLNGAILGMRKKEITRKLDEIVDFSGVERYIDTPVKRYSSGMFVRLAFAVAAHLESEILIVDEVLAVGDAEFQKKCLGKMGEVSKGEGKTVLFVSHNMAAVRKLCDKGVLLKDGQIYSLGCIDDVLNNYIASGDTTRAIYDIKAPINAENLAGFVHRVQVEDIDGKLVNEIPAGKPWQIRVQFKLNIDIKYFIIALGITDSYNVNLRTTWSKEIDLGKGWDEAVFKEEQLLFASGTYHLTLGLSSFERTIQYLENVAAITISDLADSTLDKSIIRTSGTGMILNPMNVEISIINYIK
jgi:ABC-type polysaccharide/polyol phosphate transport system ATPase subunit